MKIIRDALARAIENPPLAPMTSDEEAWWRETEKGLHRRQWYAAAAKAGAVIVVMGLFRLARPISFELSAFLIAIPFAAVLYALLVGIFKWQSGFELDAEKKKRLLGRRMHQDIIAEKEFEPEHAPQ